MDLGSMAARLLGLRGQMDGINWPSRDVIGSADELMDQRPQAVHPEVPGQL
jgi:hypothetical protein